MTSQDRAFARADQLMPTGDTAIRALQGFLKVTGYYAGKIDGDFKTNSIAAYNQARQTYAFLPDIGDSLDAAELPAVFNAIDNGLQNNVAFSNLYLRGLDAQTSVLTQQYALIGGGSWANRHLGDRISNAEPISADGHSGVLTERGLRNAHKMVGVANLQASLNLLNNAGLDTDGKFGDATRTAMTAYATSKGLQIVEGDDQGNYERVMTFIYTNELDNLRSRVAAVLDDGAPTDRFRSSVVDAQIIENSLARSGGLNEFTALDGLQNDSRIPITNSHTRTVMAPQVGIQLKGNPPLASQEQEQAQAPVVHQPPFDLNGSYRITQKRVLDEVTEQTSARMSGPNAPDHLLTYSEEGDCYVLLAKNESGGIDAYQISDRNASLISPAIQNGSIALDTIAATRMAEKMHGNRPDTRAYSSQDIRNAYVENPRRFTFATREGLLTTTVTNSSGTLRFSLDDFHDGLDHNDGRRDWSETADPRKYERYVDGLRQAAEDGREGRPVTMPQWDGELNDSNSVVVNIAGVEGRIPNEIWTRVSQDMRQTEKGFSTGGSRSAVSFTPAVVPTAGVPAVQNQFSGAVEDAADTVDMADSADNANTADAEAAREDNVSITDRVAAAPQPQAVPA